MLFIQEYHLARDIFGSFVVEESMRKDLSVSLLLKDENAVESFEVTDPEGHKHRFPTFLPG